MASAGGGGAYFALYTNSNTENFTGDQGGPIATDGDYVYFLQTAYDSSIGSFPSLAKIDINGTVIWEKYYKELSTTVYAYESSGASNNILISDDKQYLYFSIQMEGTYYKEHWVQKVNASNGTIVWSKQGGAVNNLFGLQDQDYQGLFFDKDGAVVHHATKMGSTTSNNYAGWCQFQRYNASNGAMTNYSGNTSTFLIKALATSNKRMRMLVTSKRPNSSGKMVFGYSTFESGSRDVYGSIEWSGTNYSTFYSTAKLFRNSTITNNIGNFVGDIEWVSDNQFLTWASGPTGSSNTVPYRKMELFNINNSTGVMTFQDGVYSTNEGGSNTYGNFIDTDSEGYAYASQYGGSTNLYLRKFSYTTTSVDFEAAIRLSGIRQTTWGSGVCVDNHGGMWFSGGNYSGGIRGAIFRVSTDFAETVGFGTVTLGSTNMTFYNDTSWTSPATPSYTLDQRDYEALSWVQTVGVSAPSGNDGPLDDFSTPDSVVKYKTDIS